MSLKKEGNVLHGQKKFEEASDKYKMAISNIEQNSDKDSVNLKVSCLLNLASCEHNLGHFLNSIKICNECIQSKIIKDHLSIYLSILIINK